MAQTNSVTSTITSVTINNGKEQLKGKANIEFGYTKGFPQSIQIEERSADYTLTRNTTSTTSYKEPEVSYGVDATDEKTSFLNIYQTSNWGSGFTIDKERCPLSGKYNVYIVAAPPSAYSSTERVLPFKFKVGLNTRNENGETSQYQSASVFTTDPLKYDTVKVLQNFEISYGSEVTFLIMAYVNSREVGRNYIRRLLLSRIIFEAVDDEGNIIQEPEDLKMILNGQIVDKDTISSIEYKKYDLATLTSYPVNTEDINNISIYGRLNKGNTLKDVKGYLGMHLTTKRNTFNYMNDAYIIDRTNSEYPYIHFTSNSPCYNSTKSGDEEDFSFALPILNDGDYTAQLYYAIYDSDGVMLDSINKSVNFTVPYNYGTRLFSASDVRITNVEQIPGTYDIVATIDARELVKRLKDSGYSHTIYGLEETETTGIYKKHFSALNTCLENGEYAFPDITVYIDNDFVSEKGYYEPKTFTFTILSDSKYQFTMPSPEKYQLPNIIGQNPNLTLFSKALEMTGIDKQLLEYLDLSYSCGEDSVRGDIPAVYYAGHNHSYSSGNSLRYPARRYYKYTAFVEPDSVYAIHGIYSINDLAAYAKKIYDQTYPQDAGKYDDDYTNPKNPLHRFIAYHLMDRYGSHAEWAPSGEIYSNNWKPDVADAEDFWETMSGDMICFSRLYKGELYANRKGKGSTAVVRGVRVLSEKEAAAVDANYDPNSQIHAAYLYLDDILTYNTQTRDKVLNKRMRIDATTLSPDFMNEGARGNLGKEILCMFKNDYVKNFNLSPETMIGVHNDDMWWSSYLGNAICIKGEFDVSIKMPHPPVGTYEVRLGYVQRVNGAIIQAYNNDKELGKPLDIANFVLTDSLAAVIGKENGIKNPKYDPTKSSTTQMESYEYYFDLNDWDYRYDYSMTECDEHNKLVDQYLREHGYMKAMDSYRKSIGATNFRVDSPEHMRYIFGTVDVKEGEDLLLRFKKVGGDSDSEFSLDYLELVPISVIMAGEDTH